MHRDLKLENILFANKTSNIIKIIDFGLATKFSSNRNISKLVGTPYSISPEIIKNKYNK